MNLFKLITPAISIGILGLALSVTSASAATLGFVNNPSGNSVDWANSINSLGGTVNSNVNFDAHGLGALNSTFYSATDGVTLTAGGAIEDVEFGAGPGQATSANSVPGEGLHADSNFLFAGPEASSLTISFNQGVLGAGLNIIDAFSNNIFPLVLQVEAFSGQNGTGSSLGVFNSVQQNFQQNNIYFMGVTSDAIFSSLVFRDLTNNGSDRIGLDDIVFATSNGGASIVPVPAALPLFGTGLAVMGFIGWRRKRKTAA